MPLGSAGWAVHGIRTGGAVIGRIERHVAKHRLFWLMHRRFACRMSGDNDSPDSDLRAIRLDTDTRDPAGCDQPPDHLETLLTGRTADGLSLVS